MSDKCPICNKEWTRMQSPWFRHLEYVYCETCNANEETIMKQVNEKPSLKGSKTTDSRYSYGDIAYWGSD